MNNDTANPSPVNLPDPAIEELKSHIARDIKVIPSSLAAWILADLKGHIEAGWLEYAAFNHAAVLAAGARIDTLKAGGHLD